MNFKGVVAFRRLARGCGLQLSQIRGASSAQTLPSDYSTSSRASLFERIKQNPHWELGQDYMILRGLQHRLGNESPTPLKGLSAFDAGSGTGTSSRLLVKYGASYVVGFDLSDAQVELATNLNEKHSTSIEYFQTDVRDAFIVPKAPFDVATAVFVTAHITTKEDLHKMMKNMAANLKPNGICLFVNIMFRENGLIANKHGCRANIDLPDKETTPVDKDWRGLFTLWDYPKTEEFQFEHHGHSWCEETVTRGFEGNGFKDVIFHPKECHPDTRELLGKEVGAEFEDEILRSYTQVVSAIKQ